MRIVNWKCSKNEFYGTHDEYPNSFDDIMSPWQTKTLNSIGSIKYTLKAFTLCSHLFNSEYMKSGCYPIKCCKMLYQSLSIFFFTRYWKHFQNSSKEKKLFIDEIYYEIRPLIIYFHVLSFLELKISFAYLQISILTCSLSTNLHSWITN